VGAIVPFTNHDTLIFQIEPAERVVNGGVSTLKIPWFSSESDVVLNLAVLNLVRCISKKV
jgi:hypothetical protein